MADVRFQDEIFINGQRFRTSGPVKLRSLDTIPQNIRETAFRQLNAPAKVTHIFSNTRGGGGLYRIRPEEGDIPIKTWDSLAWTMSTPAVPLPPLATSAGSPLTATDFQLLAEYNGVVYGVVGPSVFPWNGPSGTSWGASVRTLSTPVISSVYHPSGGTTRWFLLCNANIDYYDGAAWAQTTGTAADYGVSYNGFLWVMDELGAFRRNAAGTDAWGAWTTRQTLPLPYGHRVRGLILYRTADGTSAIYAKTTGGLWAYDDTNDKWFPTELQVPNYRGMTTALDSWRGLGLPDKERTGIYLGVGLSVYGYAAGDPAEVWNIGPDTQDGVPSGFGGVVAALAATHNFNLALVVGTTESSTDAEFGELDMGPVGGSEVIAATTGYTWLTAFTGLGWHKLWESGSTDIAGAHLLVANAYDTYRAYWTASQTMYWMDLPTTILNPREVSDKPYATSGRIIYPWDNGSQEGAQDLAIEIRIRTAGCSATETVTLNYATDFDDTTWTAPAHATFTSGIITANGLHTFTLGTSARGVLFDAIRLRLQGARGATTTSKPQVDYLAFDYIPSLTPVLVWEVGIDARAMYGQRSTADQLADLIDLADPQVLREVIWRNQASATDDTHQCKLVGITGQGSAGPNEFGIYTLTLLEPRP